MNTTTLASATEVFADDYLLIADNEHSQYIKLLDNAETMTTVELSDTMREEYEDIIGRVFELMAVKKSGFNEFEKCLIMQLLAGWGSDAFDRIARELKERVGE